MSQKNQKVAVVTDGASSLTPAQGLEYGIHVAPVYVNFSDKTYQAGVDLDAGEFYRLLRASKQLPTTAQPTAQDFLRLYTDLAKQAEAIVTVVISHHMSATLQSALAAQEQFSEVPVHIIDSESVSHGLGLQAIAAARAAAEGKSAQEVVQLVEQIKKNLNVMFTVETLEYLHKGGRIGGATAFLGSALSIKPILYIKDGRIEPLERQRTRKRSVARVLELVEERAGSSVIHAAILHCDVPEEARELGEQVKARFHCTELITVDAGPVIGTHAGPGTLGVAFYTL
ncbi:MAG TPA: DegV family protein [Anaerolineales bacterium]|nr:DegV family protein [Anaerolineales bacterium]HMZ06226.1 DegV family protein [Anaerolineales bacterium]HNA87700.1 DegV family protein [Anaerolineales bacterium]HNB34649.1 DegV family protein [Anaerolineales bacterium]HNC07310.1 DegV family protein [Anaerolineales bacterium]